MVSNRKNDTKEITIQGCSIIHMTVRNHLAVRKWGVKGPPKSILYIYKNITLYNIFYPKTKKSMKLSLLINLTIFVISLFVGATHAAPEADEVKSLPGWNKELPSKIYSGFISAGQDTQDGVTYNMHEQYFFVESENDPKNDPVLIWTNGGPGASSYFGLFVELGPFQANGNSLKTEEYNKKWGFNLGKFWHHLMAASNKQLFEDALEQSPNMKKAYQKYLEKREERKRKEVN